MGALHLPAHGRPSATRRPFELEGAEDESAACEEPEENDERFFAQQELTISAPI
jgi:hypothetical protein